MADIGRPLRRIRVEPERVAPEPKPEKAPAPKREPAKRDA